MCGRYASARNAADLAVTFGVADGDVEDVPGPDWNVAPTKPVPVVLTRDDRRVLTTARWGLVPSWARDPSVGARLVNARIETVAEKPAFRAALVARRCLLPADGWYEWAPRPGGGRQPHLMRRPDGAVLGLAGLWEVWYDADGRALTTVTIVTGPAPEDLAEIHDRAPVVVDPRDWTAWLAAGGDWRAVLTPTRRDTVVPVPVGDAVGDVRAHGPQLAAPVTLPEQPRLF